MEWLPAFLLPLLRVAAMRIAPTAVLWIEEKIIEAIKRQINKGKTDAKANVPCGCPDTDGKPSVGN